jgi:hypothetical protein
MGFFILGRTPHDSNALAWVARKETRLLMSEQLNETGCAFFTSRRSKPLFGDLHERENLHCHLGGLADQNRLSEEEQTTSVAVEQIIAWLNSLSPRRAKWMACDMGKIK